METTSKVDPGLYWPSICYGHDWDGRNDRNPEVAAQNIGTTDGFRSAPQSVRTYIYIIFTRKSNHKQHSYVSFAGAVILRTSHGYTIETEGLDPFVDLAEEALDRSLLPAAQSGVWAVDLFPFCMLLFLRRNNMLNSRSAVSAELASWNGIQKDSACVGKSLARFLW